LLLMLRVFPRVSWLTVVTISNVTFGLFTFSVSH
jgi:hypothetical protein